MIPLVVTLRQLPSTRLFQGNVRAVKTANKIFTSQASIRHPRHVLFCNYCIGGRYLPVAFAICFFLVVAASETLRQGVFGVNPAEISTTTYTGLALAALVILRSDLTYIFRRPVVPLYGNARLTWSVPRTVLGFLLGTLAVILPAAFGVTLIRINVGSVLTDVFADALVYQALMVALSVELFFREAAVKAFHDHLGAMILASTLAYFIFRLPEGLAPAVLSAGSGLYLMVLRLIGTNILAVSVISAAFGIVMTRFVLAHLAGPEIWTYAIYFTAAMVILSITVLSLFGPNRREPNHA